MIGSHEVKVSRRRGTSFSFTIRRNLTVVRGDSATGKTTLYDMVADYTRTGDESGVTIRCDVPCVALTDVNWKSQLADFSNSIVFIEEGFRDAFSDAFARAVEGSSNYFVLITRADIPSLPYSVDEIYRIKTSGKYHTFEPLYANRGLCRYALSQAKPKEDFDVLLTEDSKSGLQFFESRFKGTGVRCESATTNSNIARWLDAHRDDRVFVVADGAAIGPYADRLMKMQDMHRDSVTICLPESFEWLLLRSGVVKSDGLDAILADAAGHVDSRDYKSWERFFTALLVQRTAGTAFAYQKGGLADAYKVPSNAARVMALIACRNIR